MDSRLTTVAECNLDLLKNEKHCDVVLIVGESKEKISCHKVHLMSRSPVFETMFAKRWKSMREIEEIVIPDVEPSVFRQFLQYIYSDEFTTELVEAIRMLYLAHKYQVISLIYRCENFMITEMQSEYSVSFYRLASFYNLPSLKKNAGDLIAKEFSTLINDSNFNRYFKTFNEEMLLDFLSRPYLLVDDLELFDALLRWSHVQLGTETPVPSEQRRVLEKILPLVRFPLMKVQDFSMKVIRKGILTSDESLTLFTYITSEESVRTELRPKLGFAWKARAPPVSEYSVELYKAENYEREIRSNNLKEVTAQTDKIEFHFSWSAESLSSGLNKTAFISSILLRGPKYSNVTNKRTSWHLKNSWKVCLKLVKVDGLDLELEVAEKKIDNLEIFSTKDTVVDLNPPFAFQEQTNYRISVTYNCDSPVYLPNSNKVGRTDSADFLTLTRLKNNVPVQNDYGISELELEIRPEFSRNVIIYGLGLRRYRNYSGPGKKPAAPPMSSHCIRSMELKVHNY